MLNTVVRFCLVHRHAVLAIAALLFLLSLSLLRHAQYDVFPEFAPPQVSIQTEAPGFSAKQVETLVTQAVEQAVSGATGITSMQSSSIQGLSAVQVFFDNKSDVLLDRQIISERLSALTGALPSGVAQPTITPLTSTTNNILGVGFTSDTVDLAEICRFVESSIRPALVSVPGIAEAEIFGGLVRQVEIQVRPESLLKYNLSLDEVAATARKVSGIRSGGVIDTSGKRIAVETDDSHIDLETIRALPIVRGTADTLDLAITMGDVADVTYGTKTPFSAASVQGREGLVLLLTSQYKTNTLEVTKRAEEALRELRPQLDAAGIRMTEGLIRPASFVEASVSNVQDAMMIGAALVVVLLLIFLGNPKAALISAVSIPLSLGLAAAILGHFGLSLDTMTLGGLAIAVGLVVDDAVIDIENMLRRLHQAKEDDQKISRLEILLSASLEVRLPVIFATLAVLILALPIILLPGVAGNLFAPMGYAYALATLVSLLVALTVTPALAMFFLKSGSGKPSLVTRALRAVYRVVLKTGYSIRYLFYVAALLTVLLAAGLATQMKTSFVPNLREGHFIIHMELEPGASLAQSLKTGIAVTEELLKEPYIDKVVQQTGRTEGGIDVWGTHTSEFNVSIKPDHADSEDVIQEKIQKILTKFPDADFEVKTFLTERMQEVLSGETAEVTLSFSGGDLDQLDATTDSVMTLLEKNQALINLQKAAVSKADALSVLLNAQTIAQAGLLPTDVLDALQSANQGDIVGQIYDHTPPTDVVVNLTKTVRQSPEQLATLPIRTPTGAYLTLGDLAKIEVTPTPYEIQRIDGERSQSILFDLKPHEDAQAVLADIDKAIAAAKIVPLDITMKTESSFAQARATQIDLAASTAAALIAIIILLSFVLPSYRQISVILLMLPLALSGGVFILALHGFELSLGGMIGFITLFGISIRNSVILITHYRHMVEVEGHLWNLQTAIDGAVDRLLPILMTAIITGFGMLPLMLKSGSSGHEIDGPMAQVILGGLVTSTLFTLIILPLMVSKPSFFTAKSLTSEIPHAELS